VNVAQRLEQSARDHADRPALIAGDRRWTYGQLDDEASALAGGLAALGLAAGERIGLHLPNSPEFALAYYAAQKIGLVPLSLNVTYRAEEIEYIVADAAASAVVTADPVAVNLPGRERMPSVRHVIDAKELAGSFGYRLERARPVDMFPHTPHIETVAMLARARGVL